MIFHQKTMQRYWPIVEQLKQKIIGGQNLGDKEVIEKLLTLDRKNLFTHFIEFGSGSKVADFKGFVKFLVRDGCIPSDWRSPSRTGVLHAVQISYCYTY